MLAIFMTEVDVGIYNVALKVAMLISIPLTAVDSIAAPKFAKINTFNQPNELKIILKQSTKIIFFGSLPILSNYYFVSRIYSLIIWRGI